VRDPGLDRHEWETEWQALEPELEDAPAETLPELCDLVERMLVARVFPIHDAVADDGMVPDLLVEFRSAREVALHLERGDDVDPGDVGDAIENLRDIYEQLIDRPDN
jgi:hypothetical protein